MSEPRPGQSGDDQHLRELLHDVRSDLTVLAMGLEALEGVREDPARFTEILAMIRASGLEPLKQKIAAIPQIAQDRS